MNLKVESIHAADDIQKLNQDNRSFRQTQTHTNLSVTAIIPPRYNSPAQLQHLQ